MIYQAIKAVVVPDKGFKKEVYNRYNTTILLLLAVVFFIALWFSYLQYVEEFDRVLTQQQIELKQQANQINTKFSPTIAALKGMRKFAHYALANPNSVSFQAPELIQAPEPFQEQGNFYLKVGEHDIIKHRERVQNSISGLGELAGFGELKQQELAMANALTPAFIAAQNVSDAAAWFYYLSKEHFVSVYPWRSHQFWHYSEQLLQNPYVEKVFSNTHVNKNQVFWNKSIQELDGKSVISAAIGVQRKNETVGLLQVDFDSSVFEQLLPEVKKSGELLLLVDQKLKVIAHRSYQTKVLAVEPIAWRDIVPSSLQSYTWQMLSKLPNSAQIDDWQIQQENINVNEWRLIKIQKVDVITAPIFIRVYLIFLTIFFVVFLLLAIIYFISNRFFISPTRNFIRHIEHCSEGDLGVIAPAKGWSRWFKLVEDIFTQNRSLLHQQKEKNADLDAKVVNKTQELQAQSLRHERDHALLRSVIHAIPEFIIINDKQGNIVGCNSAFLAHIGQTETSLIGLSASNVLPSKLSNEIARQSQKFGSSSLSEPRAISVQTDEGVYEVYCAEFYNERGQVFGSINIIRDISAQYANQLALAQAKNQAEHANQAKNQFLANMSHEIRTPLNAIQGMVSLLNSTQLNPTQKHYLLNTQTASYSLLHLVDDLLDFSKIETGNLRLVKAPCAIDDIIAEAVSLNSTEARAKQLLINVDVDLDVPKQMITDKTRLVQVISNIINNAVKFTAKGDISINAKRYLCDEDGSPKLLIKVRDTGIGIDKSEQAKLFEIFTQVDNSMTREYGGSGLGLSICRQIINMLGGTISLDSDLGKGCEFTINLPFIEAKISAKNSLESLGAISNNDFDCFNQQKIIFYNLDVAFSDSFLKAVEEKKIIFHNIDSLAEINTCSDTQAIIFINGDALDAKNFAANKLIVEDSIWQLLKQKTALVCICQPMMASLTDSATETLSLAEIPYMILEAPYFRLSLAQIASTLDILSVSSEAIDVVEKLPLSNINLLLVEDNLVNQLVAKELLLSMGAQVFIAENGKVAIDMLDEIAVDVVLMDIQMPVMDGLTATKILRSQARFKKLPIIAMTAHVGEADRKNSLDAGINAHIGKPVTAQLLRKTILEYYDAAD